MELLQLKYFRELAQTEHLSTVAKQLNISAPSLSHTIKKLEQDLGFPLFDRVGRNIVLNSYGKQYLHYVCSALNQLEYGQQEIYNRYRSESTIELACLNRSYWSEIFEDFQLKNPSIQLHTNLILDEKALISVGIYADFYLCNLYDLPTNEFESIPIMPEEHLYLVVHKDNEYADRSSIDLRELKDPVFFSVSEVFYSYKKLEKSLEELSGWKHAHWISGDRLDRLYALHDNKCMAVSTDIAINKCYFNDACLRFIPISYPLITRQQVIAWPKAKVLNANEKVFLDYILNQ